LPCARDTSKKQDQHAHHQKRNDDKQKKTRVFFLANNHQKEQRFREPPHSPTRRHIHPHTHTQRTETQSRATTAKGGTRLDFQLDPVAGGASSANKPPRSTSNNRWLLLLVRTPDLSSRRRSVVSTQKTALQCVVHLPARTHLGLALSLASAAAGLPLWRVAKTSAC
jgi:hypothetical protein